MGNGILDRAKFSDVYFDLNTLFNNALAEAPRVTEQISTVIRMDAPLMKYKWLGAVPTMTRWVGEREIAKLRAQSQIIENEDWANGIEVERDDLDDDKLGIVAPRIRDLAQKGLDAMEEEVIGFYLDGFAGTRGLTYDGQYLFDTDHKAESASDDSQDNVSSDAFDDAGAALVSAYTSMLGFKDKNGKPLGIRPTALLHGPAIWNNVRKVLQVPFLSGGATNPNFGLVQPIMSKYITGNEWFLIDTTQGAMPVILQIRRDPTFRENGNDLFFSKKSFEFGADATFGVGYGLWQTVFGSDG